MRSLFKRNLIHLLCLCTLFSTLSLTAIGETTNTDGGAFTGANGDNITYENMDPSESTTPSALEIQPEAAQAPQEELPRLKWVENYIITNSELGVHLDKISLLNKDWSGLTAVISGGALTGPVVLSNPRMDGQYNDEASFYFQVPENSLPLGIYSIEVKNGDAVLPFDNNSLIVLQQLRVEPWFVDLSQYQGSDTALSLDVEERNGQKLYPWNAGDTLTVKVFNGKTWAEEYSEDITVPVNLVLLLTIPAQPAAAQDRHEIYIDKAGQPVARGGFNVGTSNITEITADDASNEVTIRGDYLYSYQSYSTRAEIWSDGLKLASSIYTSAGGEIRFKFGDYNFETGKDYTLKMFSSDNEVTLPLNGAIKIVPRLICANPIINLAPGQSVTINESSLAGFGWSASDALTIWMNRDWNNYQVTNYIVNDSSLTLTTLQDLQPGVYDIEVRRGPDRLGFTNIIATDNPNDVLTGTVLDSNGDPIDGGYINISKINEGWGDRIIIGHDGRFYAWKDRLRGDGTYLLTAIPGSASSDAPGNYTLNITGGNFNQDITISLSGIQVSGTVRAAGSAVCGGFVDVYDPANQWNRVQNVTIAADGTYKIGGLANGTYYLVGGGPYELDYLTTNWIEINYSGSSIALDLELTPPQITGTAADANNVPLYDYMYDISVRQINSDKTNYEFKIRNGRFLLGKMVPGMYTVSLNPRNGSEFSNSEEVTVTIDANSVASPDTLALKLTQPKLTGTIADINGNPASDGCVEIWRGTPRSLSYLNTLPAASDGSYKIGGFPDGDYYIRAIVGDYSPIYPANSSSVFTKVTLGTDSVVNLTLTDRLVPRILWIEDVQIGTNNINLRLLNFKDKDMGLFSAEVLASDGSELNPRLIIPGNNIWQTWSDYRSDEANFQLYVDKGINLLYGDYKLKLTYNGTEVGYDSSDVEGFKSVYPLAVVPKAALPAETLGMPLKLFVDNRQGGLLTGLWNEDDTLTVKLITSNGRVYPDLVCTKNADFTLNISIPEVLDGDALPNGWNRIELYKDAAILATGALLVGEPIIERINDANEGDSYIRISGQYLAAYAKEGAKGEILDTSGNVMWSSTRLNLNWEELEFYFENVQLPAGKFDFRLTVDGSVIATLPLNIVPVLTSQPRIISGKDAAVITINNSSLADDFKWSESDSISDFHVVTAGPTFYYEIDSTNGLAFDADNNLAVTISDGQGHSFPLQEGYGWIDVYKNNTKIGHATFVIAQEIITGKITNPDGSTPVKNAKVIITNLQKNYGNTTVTTDENGMFHVSSLELTWNTGENLSGDYSFVVIPPQGSEYAAMMKTFTIDAAITNSISISLAEPQISGIVKAGTELGRGGYLDIQQAIGDRWQYLFRIDVSNDGSFKIGGLANGTYYIRAFEAYDNELYVGSDFQQVILADISITGLELSLNPVQLIGDARDALGNLLKGYEFGVNIRSLDPEIGKMGAGDLRTVDGRYRAGALKPGDYAISIQPSRGSIYSQSFETCFTVKQDGTIDGNVINLQLTQPKLEGVVTDAANQPFSSGYVEVFNGSWQRQNFVTTVQLDDQGRFRIGGIENGTYYIRAALWWDSPLKVNNSQSAMTEIELTDDMTTVQLPLRDKTPRIRCVYDTSIGDDRLRFHMVNISKLDFSKLSAEILNEAGTSLETPLVFSGQDIFQTEWSDQDRDEGDISLKMGYINLPVGKYNLCLKYDNLPVENETPFVGGFNGFNIMYYLNIKPNAVLPWETAGKELELALNMDKADYPWVPADSITVTLMKADGSLVTLAHTIAPDKTLTATLLALAAGSYRIMVYNDSRLLAEGDMVIGLASIYNIGEITEYQPRIQIFGRNLSVYMDPTTEAKIYDAAGTSLIYTTRDIQFIGDFMEVVMNDKPLGVGEYKLELTYNNGMAVNLPNEGRFNVVRMLYTTPAYVLSGQSPTLTLRAAIGKPVPWVEGDTVEMDITSETGYGMEESYTVTPSVENVKADSAIVSLPAIAFNGRYSIRVFKVTDSNTRIYIGYANFYSTGYVQLKGTVLDGDGNAAPNSFVYLKKKGDDKWGMGFDADSLGQYGVYNVEPGEYTAFASQPKDSGLLDSAGFDLTIYPDGTSSAVTHDFQLPPSHKISGVVRLPGSDVAPSGGINVWINAWTDKGTPGDGSDDIWFGNACFIPEGESSATYSISVPANNNDYYVQLWSDGPGLVSTATLYGAAGSVFAIAEAQKINVLAEDKSGIDITLAYGTKISGIISMPSNEVAPPGGIKINISVANKNNENYLDDFGAGIDVTIPQGFSSQSYELFMPLASGYKVSYNLDPAYGYMGMGFYKTEAETTFDYNQAASIDVGDKELTDINLTLVKIKYLKGTVFLPNGELAPEGGYDAWVTAMVGSETQDGNDDVSFGSGVRIEGGKNSGDYTIAIPDQFNDFLVMLWCGASDFIDGTTYYSSKGNVFSLAEAEKVNFPGGEKSDVNITLTKGTKISGTVSLPSGTAAPAGGIKIYVGATVEREMFDYRDDISTGVGVFIGEGQSSADYEITVLPMNGYKVEYRVEPSYNYMENGYFKTGTVIAFDYGQATVLDASTQEQTGTDMTLVPAKYIKGTISLPDGESAPDNGYDGWIAIWTRNAPDNIQNCWFGTSLRIEGGQNSADYTVAVPAAMNGFIVQVWCDGPGFLDSPTFYSDSGSKFALSGATEISFNSLEKTGINVALAKGNAITGTITLPDAAPEGGEVIIINAMTENGTPENRDDDFTANTRILVPAGQTSAEYTIIVPAAKGYKVQYISDPAYPNQTQGFYTKKGTVYDYSAANLVNATKDVSGIDLMMSSSAALEITITGVYDGGIYSDKVTIGIDVTNTPNNQTSVVITMDGKPYEPGKFKTEGKHILSVIATDALGNTVSKTVTFTIDKNVPKNGR